ncbi:MAG: hypothetical protein D8M58_16980 [Calditrichaeota bacterium]|nr:hypothetical protein [Calditrichota bacterium]NOG46932.1 hypothetical protein [Calditrichota bacterium]
MNISQIEEAFNDIVLGNGVKRSVHDLVYDNADYSDLFITCLKRNNFFPLPLKHTTINPGFRYPGFYLIDSVAYFGHLFWEVFSESRKRKIWGSVVRNEKGDWKYILPGNSSKIVYINKDKIQAVDIFHLT